MPRDTGKLSIVCYRMGWRGTDRQWSNFRVTYLTLACLLIPLAVSVHSIVATDFAVSQQPGWHTTSFPPYFVAGALYSGCAAIITLFIMLRYTFRFEQYMTIPILEKLCKLTFAISMVWTYLNLIEYAAVWYGTDPVAKQALIFRATGDYAWWWWAMNFFASVLPFTLTWKRLRTNIPIMLVVSAAAQSRHVDRALHDRHAHFCPWLLSVDVDPGLVAELGAGGHHPRQLRLVQHAVHAVLQDLPLRIDVRGQGNGLSPSCGRARPCQPLPAGDLIHEEEGVYPGVVRGIFDEAAVTIAALRESSIPGFKMQDVTLKSPIDHPECSAELGRRPVYIQIFSLLGADARQRLWDSWGFHPRRRIFCVSRAADFRSFRFPPTW